MEREKRGNAVERETLPFFDSWRGGCPLLLYPNPESFSLFFFLPLALGAKKDRRVFSFFAEKRGEAKRRLPRNATEDREEVGRVPKF